MESYRLAGLCFIRGRGFVRAFNGGLDATKQAAGIVLELDARARPFLFGSDSTGCDILSAEPFSGAAEIKGEALDQMLCGFAAIEIRELRGQPKRWEAAAGGRRTAAPAPAIQTRDEARRFLVASTALTTIRAAAGDGLPSFSGNAYTGAPMRPDGWFHQVIIDLAGVNIPMQHRPVLRQHDHEQILGHTTRVQATTGGIEVEGVFSGRPKEVETVTVPARNGFRWQLSVGASPLRTEFLESGEEDVVNGRTVSGPMTISRETEIGEVSFVPLGADGDTSAEVQAAA